MNPTNNTVRYVRATFFTILGILSAVSLKAQTTTSEVPYAVVDSGPYYRVLQRTVWVTNTATGEMAQQVQRYTDLEDGMNYLSNGAWVAAEDLIELTPTGAQAVHGQMTAQFDSDITSVGAITLTTASGELFQSHPLGLFYSDSVSGKLARIGTAQPSVGTLYPPNVIVFSNVLSGVQADLMLVWAKNGYEQNLILKQSPPRPESFGLSSRTSTLQFWSAMDSCPVPQEQRSAVLSSGLEDHILFFASSWFPVGAAYAFGDKPLPAAGQPAPVRLIRPSDPGTIPVAKSLVTISGQQVLIEEVWYSDLASILIQLPQASLSPHVDQTIQLADRARFLKPSSKPNATSGAMQLASHPYAPKGVVLDYVELSGSATSYTFTNYSTYHIARSFSVGPGTATFQAAYIKCDTNAYLLVTGNPTCTGSSGAPTVLTTRDDNAYGAVVTNSTGNPGYAAAEAIWMYYQTSATTLQDLLIRWAQTGIRYDGSTSQPRLYYSSLQHSSTGVYMNVSTNVLYLTADSYCDVVNPILSATDGPPNTSGAIVADCGDTRLDPSDQIADLQHESSVAINPSDPTKMAIVAAQVPNNQGFFKVTSSDGGKTWTTPVLMATGSSADGLLAANGDVQAAYDAVGNLYVCYTTPDQKAVILARSRDGGATWPQSYTNIFPSSLADRPVLATGPGGTYASSSIWLMYVDGGTGGHITLAGAPVDANGNVGSFTSYAVGCSTISGQHPPVSTGLAVGPTGKVLMAYESYYEPDPSSRYIYIIWTPTDWGRTKPLEAAPHSFRSKWNGTTPSQPSRADTYTVFRSSLGTGTRLVLTITGNISLSPILKRRTPPITTPMFM